MQADLGGLGGLIKITGAEAALHCHPEVTLTCQAVVTLAVSGRELHAAARDHTWLAAWRKVVARLRAQIVEQRRLGLLPRRIPRKPAAARAAKPTF